MEEIKENITNEELGKRLKDVCGKLNNIGVFYGKNYDGKYHEKYPHHKYWISMDLDNHRSGFTSMLMNDGYADKILGDSTSNPPHLQIIEALETTLKAIELDLDKN